jgi:hypothetical protein
MRDSDTISVQRSSGKINANFELSKDS